MPTPPDVLFYCTVCVWRSCIFCNHLYRRFPFLRRAHPCDCYRYSVKMRLRKTYASSSFIIYITVIEKYRPIIQYLITRMQIILSFQFAIVFMLTVNVKTRDCVKDFFSSEFLSFIIHNRWVTVFWWWTQAESRWVVVSTVVSLFCCLNLWPFYVLLVQMGSLLYLYLYDEKHLCLLLHSTVFILWL